MRIRTYLTLSYLAIIVVITLGMMVVADLTINRVAAGNLSASEDSIRSLTNKNYELSEKILTAYGEKIVEAKAEEVARQVASMLGDRKSYDYDELRKDEELRRISTQDVLTSNGTAGYLTLGDRTGVAVLHPNRGVEGRNFREWSGKFPEMWRLVERSFTERKVKGYYSFVDRRKNRGRKKYMVLVQAPRTPLTVAATVYIDQYFLPAHQEIKEAGESAMGDARRSIERSSEETRGKVKLIGLGGSLGLLAVGGVFGLWFAAFISAPILRLRDGVKKMGKGDFAVGVREEGAREVKQLAQSFNRLGSQLIEYIDKRDFIRDTFGRYLTQEVVDRLLESKDGLKLGGETREISMIMSDLRGFTALTSSRPPDQVIEFLNLYLGKMLEILLDFRGVVDEIIGDGILAFFGAPEPMEDHPQRAVACALKMQATMDEVNALNEAEGLPRLEMGIAVNTGPVVVGNIGSEKRAKYGAVGSQVNLTGRVESFTVGGQVLISQTTYEQVSDLVEVGNVLEVEMKGVPGKVKLYDVRGIGGTYNVHLQDKQEPPIPLGKSINVEVHRMDKKVVTGAETKGRITGLSRTSAAMVVQVELGRWEDVRLQLLNDELEPVPGEIYAKVVSVTDAAGDRAEEAYEAELHFTSVSSEASQVFRQAQRAT